MGHGQPMGYGQHVHAANMQVAQAVTKTMSAITIVIIAGVALAALVVIGAVIVLFMARGG
jgi:hypothetical protein